MAEGPRVAVVLAANIFGKRTIDTGVAITDALLFIQSVDYAQYHGLPTVNKCFATYRSCALYVTLTDNQ